MPLRPPKKSRKPAMKSLKTFVPMLCSRWLTAEKSHGKLYQWLFVPFNKVISWISRGYAHVIRWSVKRGVIVVSVFVVMFVLSLVFLVPGIKTEYFPRGDSERISATIKLPNGTAQDVTRDFYYKVYDEIVAAVPEIKVFNGSFGPSNS